MTWRDEGLFLTRRLFLGFLAIIYGIAFLSLWVQVEGLVGSEGILPASRLLQAIEERWGVERYWFLPTLSWISPSDGFLHFLCGGGVALSVLALLWLAPAAVFFLLWAFYLSLMSVGGDFLHFQWDSLLLETGFLAIFLAPWRIQPSRISEGRPSLLALWLLRFLLFRLMFSSGAVKLSSGDETWWNMTALLYHYQTQPLPTWVGWFAHQLPPSFQKTSVAVMFGAELAVPFLIFLPRGFRLGAFFPLTIFQLLIGLTGNYCFFNLLTLALCLLLLDDRFLRWVLRRPAPQEPRVEVSWSRDPAVKRFFFYPVAAVVLAAGGTTLVFLAPPEWRPDFLRHLQHLPRLVAPLHCVNHYGLFRVMTTSRPEITVEGSNDGLTWSAYEFKWKPGDLNRRPSFVAPHQPRLDWQMWFAALGSFQRTPWFQSFLVRLLTGSPAVLALLEKNPFPDSPPRYVRAVVHEYRFTDLETWRATGAWWRRELKGLYSPVLSLPAR